MRRRFTEQDISSLIGTNNAGYTIEQARHLDEGYIDSDCFGIALAKDDRGNYVTWQFCADEDTGKIVYYWGHYHLTNALRAIEDYNERCN